MRLIVLALWTGLSVAVGGMGMSRYGMFTGFVFLQSFVFLCSWVSFINNSCILDGQAEYLHVAFFRGSDFTFYSMTK